MTAKEVLIDGVRYVPAVAYGATDVSGVINEGWSGAGKMVRFQFDEPGGIYADEALTVPLANPVCADARGLYPQIWTDARSLWFGFIDEHGVLKSDIKIVPPRP